MKAQYSYTPFGERTKIAGSGPEADFGFAGMYHHARSGLNLTLFRAYNPALGRWLSRDPLGESMGTNLYSYVGNSPINFIDPLGLTQADADRIMRDAMRIRDEMTKEGILGPGKASCVNASDELAKRLRELLYPNIGPPATEDPWRIATQTGYGGLHSRAIGLSNNPADPVVIMDPWGFNEFRQLGPTDPMPLWNTDPDPFRETYPNLGKWGQSQGANP